jgi:hypothetical protein
MAEKLDSKLRFVMPGLPGPASCFALRRDRLRSKPSIERSLVGRPGLALADGSDLWLRPGIAGHRPLADGGEKPRPQGASNPGPPE